MTNRDDDKKQSSQTQKQELQQKGSYQHASADQGGTTDLKNDAAVGTTPDTERGSGSSTKRNITGSDYDGQVAN